MELSNQSLLQTKAYINGEWITQDGTFDVINPYNQQVLASVSNCGVEETHLAIESAHEAFSVWKEFSASKRSRILLNWHNLIIKNIDDLAKILTLEQGKPFTEAKGEIKYGASFIQWFAEEAKRVYGDVIPGQTNKNRIVVIKQPIGVVGAITPWNFPNAMITRKIAPALAAGCTIVLKPAEDTPLSALALAQLAKEAGFPNGVINIVPTNCPAPIGQELCTNPKIKKISFTGSTEVGRILLKQSAHDIKKVSLELGGNAPFIVFDDADIDLAVEQCIATKFRNTGQTCISTNRIFLSKEIKEEFITKLISSIKQLKQGDGMTEGTNLGPLINQAAMDSNLNLIQDSIDSGATLHIGGQQEGESLFISPTILSDLNERMKIFSTEIFGPIAALYSFEDDEDVIRLANHTEYGLAAYFFSRDYERIWRIAEQLEYGMIGINTGNISTTLAPFGGIKHSGMGKEGSKYGIDDFVTIKYLNWFLKKK